jgi:hypothetical protein
MALIFARLARNFIKNGYFPTDERTLGRILGALEPAGPTARILDPCCGEGTALAEIRRHLQEDGTRVDSLGVECDRERAWHAKTLLDRVIHSDIHDVVIGPRSVGLLFLNPPYGHGVADKAGTGDGGAVERLEKTFVRKTASNLAHGGVLVLIVPHHVVDRELATFIARHFRELRMYMAPEQRFKQCIVFGIKERPRHPAQAVLESFERLHDGGLSDELPEDWPHARYRVPAIAAHDDFRFHAVRLDGEQLADELHRFRRSTLWEGFESFFRQGRREHRRPLREMSQWHLALALAAGQVTGIVRSPAGRVLLIKGDTHKQKERTTVVETDDQGNVTEVVTLTDRFVPVINAIEFTPGPQLGRIVTIR